MPLAIACLGGFRVTVDQQPAGFATNPTRALLTYLALETGPTGTRAHHRETLADLLWPEYLERAARLNLSQTLARLRRAIRDHQSDPAFLQISRQSIQLDPTLVTVDVWRFQELIATCLAHAHSNISDCPTCCSKLVEATDLYRGPLLTGALWTDSRPFEEWLLLKREQLQRQFLDALYTLALHAEATHAYEEAQQYAQQQLAVEPWREAAHRQLLRALALSGQRSAALNHYENCRRILRTELDIDPDPATVALIEQIRAGELSDKMTRWQDDKLQGAAGHPAIPSPPHPATLSSAPRNSYKILGHLDVQPNQRFFGIAEAQVKLAARLQASDAPWLLAVDGIGGIGKTTLAGRLIEELATSGRFADIAWVSARQAEYRPATGLQRNSEPALNVETLTTRLLEQLCENPPLTASNQEKQLTLMQLLKSRSYLVVIDNLETVVDATALVPFLRQLANPSKFLLTSRLSLQSTSGVYCHSLQELGETDALAMLRHEAESRGIQPLIDARQTQLRTIYQVVGGNPLALKLVLAQIRFLPLSQVLTNLQEAQGQPIHDLYTYIYWQAWHLLDDAGRRLLLILPIEANSTYTQLAALQVLDVNALQQALAQLLTLSLIQVTGDLEQPRYTLHRLTETFLMREVVQWLTP